MVIAEDSASVYETESLPETVAAMESAPSAGDFSKLIGSWREGLESQTNSLPLEEVSVPVAHYPDGRVRAQLSAEKAWLPPQEEDFFRAVGISIQMLDEESRFSGILIADNCIFDRGTLGGYCEGPVRFQMANLDIRGTNMTWNANTMSAKISGGAFVKFNRFMKDLGDSFK